jgi:hypothetical protein
VDAVTKSALRWQSSLDRQAFEERVADRERRILSGELNPSAMMSASTPAPQPEPVKTMTQHLPKKLSLEESEGWNSWLQESVNNMLNTYSEAVGEELGTITGKMAKEFDQRAREMREEIVNLQLRLDQLEAKSKSWWRR